MTRATVYSFTACAIALCAIGAAVGSILLLQTNVNEASPGKSATVLAFNGRGFATSSNTSDLSAQSQSARRRESSITGQVLNDSGQGIPGADVEVRKAGAQITVGRYVATDENGRFRADDLEPGSYSVNAYAPAFVYAIEATQRQYYHIGDAVVLKMVKGAVIPGAGAGSAGEPLVGFRVSAIRVRDGENRPLRGPAQWGTARLTDDRGVYRLYGLGSGSYVVVAGGGQAYPPSDYDSDA